MHTLRESTIKLVVVVCLVIYCSGCQSLRPSADLDRLAAEQQHEYVLAENSKSDEPPAPPWLVVVGAIIQGIGRGFGRL